MPFGTMARKVMDSLLLHTWSRLLMIWMVGLGCTVTSTDVEAEHPLMLVTVTL